MLALFQVKKHDAQFTFQHRAPRLPFAAFLVALMFAPSALAQGAASSQPSSDAPLYINVIQGEDGMNNIHAQTAQEPIVQVTDAHDKPLRGVAVVFTEFTGAAGAGAAFGSSQTFTTETGADGKATANGFRPNQVLGKYTVKVAARAGTAGTAIDIHETNVSKDAVVAVAAGGGASGAVLAGVLPKLLAAGSVAAGAVVGIAESFRSSSSPTIVASSPTPSLPLSVPEIDLSMAFGGLVLLAGSVAVLRGR